MIANEAGDVLNIGRFPAAAFSVVCCRYAAHEVIGGDCSPSVDSTLW